MLLILVSAAVLHNFAFAEDLKDLSPLELIKLGQDISQIHPDEVKPTDVQFYILTKDNLEPTLISAESKELVNVTKQTIIIIHGWLENHRRSWYKNVADQFFVNGDINFIEVDWERPARMPYVYSAKATRMVGNEVAQFIEDFDLFSNEVYIIGHSLGAHIAGFAGKKYFEDTGEKLKRITGLDPAGPYFRHASINPSERLDKDDAEIVDAIHTDAGFYGYENPIGSFDIYVNGGQRIQPGCLDEWTIPTSFGDMLEKSFCSHARSTKYFTEWISTGKFKCKFCTPLLEINLFNDRCALHHNSDRQVLGFEDVTVDITGVCFAETNKEEPYLS
ncbi:unnamed protein product [Ceutorhynchus assimilis]|uniref:Lipase domain-containing protein n=1 Tax=Ceutorhynchus assimilis TaxID=467358 RepID=A0A9N9MA04_9CUCU|nr:unnamed protein product [Ceutorhynchus assimilis]